MAIYPVARLILWPLIKGAWIKKIDGIENIPNGPFIFACNHSSFIDDVVVPFTVASQADRYIHVYCNDKFFNYFLIGNYLRWGKAIPIRVYKSKDQKEINKKAFDLALGYLKNNEPVGIFPEGHISKDGKLQKAYYGVAALALKAHVPVLPIGTVGSYDIMPKGQKMPNLKKCTIHIGNPMYFKQYFGKEKNKKVLKHATNMVMQKIAQLSKQEWVH